MKIVLEVNIEQAGYAEGDPRISDISFQVRNSELLGIIGPNGAGKSTTIKTILGLLKHVKAEVSIGGGSGTYAYIPEQPVFYEDLTLWEHLDLAGAAYEIDYDTFVIHAEKLLTRFGMTESRDLLPAGFSKGMKQKMMLMIGFLARPDIYIIDEPFVGLDPHATKDFLDLLEEERHRGAGVLMSTHVLDTAEKICDSFIMIGNGKVVAQGTLDEIRRIAEQSEQASLFECFDVMIKRRENLG
ncbi:ABC transporter ATP-binding protein [Paenibacillus crassostreae]|uniref:ABC transporter ATP-binding protein n=1 Tax=Paenibacillus crassostreae TaxID=1763538 RepID=A0A167AIQ4_9BACL|nr:ABC transporter ATP-binding protein [Paenibacillus crassostreae]AOZ92359.1 ABC transporter ATP-binding protein [Paenibacillus crassostreae]OAB71074.1 ABC transporter ATP-binding protein [Paenibacillus crassostreae]